MKDGGGINRKQHKLEKKISRMWTGKSKGRKSGRQGKK